tara:strand:- start:112 stop:1011 length:900 start_codon:yes stop_codon:yes gene_type:complete
MILVIGDLILDESSIFNSDRMCPEAQVPVFKLNKKFFFIGGAGNVANNLKNLNSNVFLISKTGNSENSKKLLKMIKNRKIKNKIFIQNSSCTTKKRIFNNSKMVLRIDDDCNISFNKSEISKIKNFITKNIFKFKILIISDYNKGLINKKLYSEVTRIFNLNNKIVITNPKKRQIKFYDGCDIIIPNQMEFDNFFKKKINLNSKIKILFRKIKNLKHLIVTRGHKNLIYKKNQKKIKLFKINKVIPSDVTGASDTFIATLSFMILRGKSVNFAIEKAILASKKIIQKKYTSLIKLKEIT